MPCFPHEVSMEVEAAVETPLVFAGEQIRLSVKFNPPPDSTGSGPSLLLLSGYAVVQGSFKLGDMMLSEPFADTRKQGIVLTKRGIEYGQPQYSGSLIAGVLDGLKHLVVAGPSEGKGPANKNEDISSTNPTRNSRDTPSDTSHGAGISFSGGDDHDEGDYPIFATSQLLLFSDLELSKPETFHFTVDLPSDIPPTYRSRSLQVSYSLVVGFERIRLGSDSKPLDSSPKDTRLFLPFRLMAKPPTIASPNPPKFDLLHPINAPPPIMVSEKDVEYYDAARHEHEDPNKSENNDLPKGEIMDRFISDLLNGDVQSRKRNRSSSVANLPGAQYSKVSYDIGKAGTPIAQLVLAKPVTFVGDVLAARIRFSRPCLHVSVFLDLEEQIEEPFAALAHTSLSASSPSTSGNNSSTDADAQPEVAAAYTVYARHFQGAYGLEEIPLYLPTLTSITPRLDTEQITASWSLRIEFVGLAGSAFASDDENGFQAKGQVDHELFSCRIPVIILPPHSGGHSVSKTWRF